MDFCKVRHKHCPHKSWYYGCTRVCWNTFCNKTVQPVLEKLDPVYEEAAGVMGAGRFRIFRKIILPEILPSVLTGFGLAFGRCLGEYGSVVFIAGNKPFETEITRLSLCRSCRNMTTKCNGNRTCNACRIFFDSVPCKYGSAQKCKNSERRKIKCTKKQSVQRL